MKNIMLVTLILAGSTAQAHAFRTPLQVNNSIARQVLDNLDRQDPLTTWKLTKLTISQSGTYAKAELEDGVGACVPVAFEISYDNQGAPEVHQMINAFVVCDGQLNK